MGRVIIRVLIQGKQEIRVGRRSYNNEAKVSSDVRIGLQAKECRWLLESEKGKEVDSPLTSPGGMQPC